MFTRMLFLQPHCTLAQTHFERPAVIGRQNKSVLASKQMFFWTHCARLRVHFSQTVWKLIKTPTHGSLSHERKDACSLVGALLTCSLRSSHSLSESAPPSIRAEISLVCCSESNNCPHHGLPLQRRRHQAVCAKTNTDCRSFAARYESPRDGAEILLRYEQKWLLFCYRALAWQQSWFWQHLKGWNQCNCRELMVPPGPKLHCELNVRS